MNNGIYDLHKYYFSLFLCPVSISGEQFVTVVRNDKATKFSDFKADVLTQDPYSKEMQIIGEKKLKRKGDGYTGISLTSSESALSKGKKIFSVEKSLKYML